MLYLVMFCFVVKGEVFFGGRWYLMNIDVFDWKLLENGICEMKDVSRI